MRDDAYEWDDAKAESNRRKHGVPFDAARAVFEDPLALETLDDAPDEERWIRIGRSTNRVLTVVYTDIPNGHRASGSYQPERRPPMNKTTTSGKRYLNGDIWFDDNGVIQGYPDEWDPPMTEAEREMAALSDPDNPPISRERLATMGRVSFVAALRRSMGLSQAEFSARFQIPLGTLRDWEQNRREPDQAARAYLKVIAHDPKIVAAALVA